MTRPIKIAAVSVAIFVAVAGHAHASIINSPNVIIGGNPYRTFTDTTTSLVWLDVDNFWDGTSSYNSIVALLAGSGFHLATQSELSALQASIPAIPANYTAEAIIAGGNYIGHPHPGDDRELMWGIYEDGDPSDGVPYSYRFGLGTSWNDAPNTMPQAFLLGNVNTTNQDLGAFVVADAVALASTTPEPSTVILASLGLLTLGLIAWRRTRRGRIVG